MNRKLEVEDKIIEILMWASCSSTEGVKTTHRFYEDLSMDSLDVLNAGASIEHEYDIIIIDD